MNTIKEAIGAFLFFTTLMVFICFVFALAEAEQLKGAQVGLKPSLTTIRDLHNAGAKLVRYQIYADWKTLNDLSCEDYKDNARDYLDHLDTIITKYSLQYVLDIHTPVGGRVNGRDLIFSSKNLQSCLISLWQEIAIRYKNHPQVIAYDLLNEPLSTPWRVRRLMNRLYNAIRAIDPTTIIVLKGRHDAARSFKYLKFKNDPNVWYSFHFYDPASLTHNGVWEAFQLNVTAPKSLEKYIGEVLVFKSENPAAKIYVGEFGCSIYNNPEQRYLWFKTVIEMFNSYGFYWTAHAFREAGVWNFEADKKIWDFFKYSWRVK